MSAARWLFMDLRLLERAAAVTQSAIGAIPNRW